MDPCPIEHDAPIPTWFGVGGRADRLARPRSIDELRACLRMDPRLRVLGAGANLLVDDDGVSELVVSLSSPAFTAWSFDDKPEPGEQAGANPLLGIDVPRTEGCVRVMAGADLPKLILEAVRRGCAGLEGLGGIPANVGGALVMNAGGTFGQIADVVERVFAFSRDGSFLTLERTQIEFGYRRSGLNHLILLGADLRLGEAGVSTLRTRLKEVMAYKASSQPMSANSAGCCFKNPTLARDVDGIGRAGDRVSAGLIIDRASCKGLRVGSASVSDRHANFLMVDKGAVQTERPLVQGASGPLSDAGGYPAADGTSAPPVTIETHRPRAKARDVIDLIALVQQRVRERFAIDLETEVVIWRRHVHARP